jgi:glycosyltransferase involved in cell wall biosynthesis
MPTTDHPTSFPRVSVIVRSYRRPAPLLELVGRLVRQRYPSFDVVILEQSDDPSLVARLRALQDSRIRVVVSTPLDPPAARNEAIRHAQGDILLFIDDDDLPIGRDWIGQHARNYADPSCMGVAGRSTADPEGKRAPRFPRLLRALAMRQTFFKDTVAYAHNTLRKENVDFLIGTNASVRRSLVERIGGWDEGIPMHEEQSFAIKFQRHRHWGERFVFDPDPTIQRRTMIDGGLSRRTRTDWYAWELEARLFYYEHVVGHYFPYRYRLLYGLFLLRSLQQVLAWIWDPDNRHRPRRERLAATVYLVRSFPAAVPCRRFSVAGVRRVEHLRLRGDSSNVASVPACEARHRVAR